MQPRIYPDLRYVCSGEIKVSDLVCVVLWILAIYISVSLLWDIIKKRLKKLASNDKIPFLLIIISCEIHVRLSQYIYKQYATNTDEKLKILLTIPLAAFFIYSIIEFYDEFAPINDQRMKYHLYNTVMRLSYYCIMTVNATLILITGFTGASRVDNLMYRYIIKTAVLGLSGMMYIHCFYITNVQFEQLKNLYMPYPVYRRSEMESRANPDGELVTGLPQNCGDVSYLIKPIAATIAVTAFSAFVAGNI